MYFLFSSLLMVALSRNCTTKTDAHQCSNNLDCCNTSNSCATSISQCSIYSSAHCLSLECPTCCIMKKNNHTCASQSECEDYFNQEFVLYSQQNQPQTDIMRTIIVCSVAFGFVTFVVIYGMIKRHTIIKNSKQVLAESTIMTTNKTTRRKERERTYLPG